MYLLFFVECNCSKKKGLLTQPEKVIAFTESIFFSLNLRKSFLSMKIYTAELIHEEKKYFLTLVKRVFQF